MGSQPQRDKGEAILLGTLENRLHRLRLARLRRVSNEIRERGEVREYLLKYGFITPEGELHPRYGGPQPCDTQD